MKILLKISRNNFNVFYGKEQHLSDSQISWDFPTEIVDFVRNLFSNTLKLEKKIDNNLELDQNPF